MRILTLCALALFAGLFGATEASAAQSYPVRTVRITKLVDAGLIVANQSPEYFNKFFKDEYAKYDKLVRDIGLKPR